MRKKLEELFKLVSPMIPAAILLKGIAIVDQLFAAQLGMKYLNSHTFIIYLPFLLAPIGRAMGMPLLVILNKEREKAGSYVLSGILISVILAILTLVVAISAKNIFYTQTNIYVDNFVDGYYTLQAISCALLLCNSFFNFIFLSQKKSKLLLISYSITFGLNLLGNFISIELMPGPSALLGLGVATLLSTFAQFLYQIKYVLKLFPPNLNEGIFVYLTRAKKIAISHLFITIMETAVPLIFATLIQIHLGKDQGTVFNMTNKILNFLCIPLIPMRTIGSAWIHNELKNKSKMVIKPFYYLMALFTLIPLVILIALPNELYMSFVGLKSSSLSIFSKLLLLQSISIALFIFPNIKFDLEEKSWANTLVSLLNSITVIALIYTFRNNLSNALVLSIFLIPRAVIYIPMHLIVFHKNLNLWTIKSKFCICICALFFILEAHAYQQEKLDVFKVGYLGEKLTPNPRKIISITQYLMTALIHKPLVDQGTDGRIRSSVASSWKIKKNFSEYQFQLKRNLYFNDGKRITCPTVKASFINTEKNELQKEKKYHLANIKKVSCKDELLTFTLNKSSYAFLDKLSLVNYAILKSPTTPLIGVGDYKLIDKDGPKLKIREHSSYETNNPTEIHFKNFKTRAVLLDQFKKGKIHYIPNITYETDLDTFSSEMIDSKVYNRIHLLAFGREYAEKSYKTFRQCIFQRLNRRSLSNTNKKIYLPSISVNPPGMNGYLAYNKTTKYKQSICPYHNRALSLITIRNRYPTDLKLKIKQQLVNAGINVKIEALPLVNFLERFNQGDFDISLFTFGIDSGPTNNFKSFYTKNDLLKITKITASDNITIDGSSEISEQDVSISVLQSIENNRALIIPLLFEKNISLLNRCLSFKERQNASSGNVDAHKVRKALGCKI